MEFKTQKHSFSSYVDAVKFSSTKLTFDQLMKLYRELPAAEKQQIEIFEYIITGSYDTILFTRYEIVNKAGASEHTEVC